MVLLNFSWLEDDGIAGCAYPASDDALADLEAHGIALVINLAEQPHDPRALARHGLVELHLAVPDFTPPTPELLEQGSAAIERARASGQRVVVHCAAGLGGTGTLLAAYLVHAGMAPAASGLRYGGGGRIRGVGGTTPERAWVASRAAVQLCALAGIRAGISSRRWRGTAGPRARSRPPARARQSRAPPDLWQRSWRAVC